MPVKVLLVDDSAVIRGLMHKALSADAHIIITGSAANGAMAIAMAREQCPDVIILDIEMPVMDGIAAFPELLKACPGARIIMASTLTQRNAAISMQALALGATDYLAKPSAQSGSEAEEFYRDLIAKVKALGGASLKAAQPVMPPAPASPAPRASSPAIALNPHEIKALAIASSTGGPQALMTLFAALKGKLAHIPIFITQHMPPTFTAILAEQMGKTGGRHCLEAKDGMAVAPGCAYVAPGDYHMTVEKNGGGIVLRTRRDPPENFCRPAADPMLRSLSAAYGGGLAVLILTGMGHDGLEGAREAVKNGGSVIAQDEASCIVYGMPKAVIENKLCKSVLPLPEIGPYLIQQIDGPGESL